MKHYDADADRSITEAITFKASGKTYTVLEVTDEMLEEVQRQGEAVNEGGEKLGSVLSAQLSLFTGMPREEFETLSLRQRAAICKWVSESLLDIGGTKAKNARTK